MSSAKLRKPTREQKDEIYGACENNDVHTLQQYTSQGVDVTGIIRDRNDWTGLHVAAGCGANDVIRYLIGSGAAVNVVDISWMTPLHYAAYAYGGHTDSVALLVAHDARTDMKDWDGDTPLQLAVQQGRANTVEYFIHQVKMDPTQFDQWTQQKITRLLQTVKQSSSSLDTQPSGSPDPQQEMALTFPVSVKESNGRNNYQINVGSNWNVAQVKQALLTQRGLQANQFKLVFAGIELKDNMTLEDIGVRSTSTLHCVRGNFPNVRIEAAPDIPINRLNLGAIEPAEVGRVKDDGTVTELRHDIVTLKNQMKRLQTDHGGQLTTINSTIDKLHQSIARMEEQQRTNVAGMEERMEKMLAEIQKSNKHLHNQLSLTQQQLLGVQAMLTHSRLWLVSHDQFTIGREIGRGAWATVHETTFRGATVAAKRLHNIITSDETRKSFKQEMEMALHCQHENIVTFLGATMEGHPVILMEMMTINLRSAYEQGVVKGHQILGIFLNVANALHFLHTRPKPVIHRDVSSANVLLKDCGNDSWVAKLGDLGTARIQQQTTTPGPGSIAYAAPEVAVPLQHSPKMDVYSFGVLILETLTKTHPFNKVDILKARIKQQFPRYHQLVSNCTSQKATYRPEMFDVIEELNKI